MLHRDYLGENDVYKPSEVSASDRIMGLIFVCLVWLLIALVIYGFHLLIAAE